MMQDNRRTRGEHDEREPSFSVIDKRPVVGDEAAASQEPRYPSVVEEMKARAEEAERRTREISAAYRRIEDERDAFRVRLSRDLERRVEMARVDLLRKVLGVLDDLDRAIAAGPPGPADDGSLRSGVTLIRDHLLQVLSSEGVQALDLAGQRFDPAVAEAVSVEETTDPARDGLIVAENGRGYMLGGTLLRPARVRVARFPGTGPAPARNDAGAADRESGTSPPPAAGRRTE
jgi:molecular chaperone GrpE